MGSRLRVVKVVPTVGLLLAIVLAMPCFAEQSASDLLATAEAARASGDLAQAKQLLSQIIASFPQTKEAAKASWRLGYIACAEKDLVQAERHFQWVADMHPSHYNAPDSLLRIAYLARKQNRPDALLRFLDVVIRYPDSSEAKLARYRAARLQGRDLDFDTSVQNFATVKDDPAADVKLRAEAATLEGMTYLDKFYKTGDEADLAKGIAALEGVQQHFPKDTKGVAWSRFRLGIYYAHEGRSVKDEKLRNNPARGREILQDAIKNLPFNYFTWWMKAEVAGSYVAEGRNDQVVAECESILAENPPDSWSQYLMYLLGSAQMDVGQKSEGIATFNQLMETYPRGEWAEAAGSRIKTLSEQGGDGR